MKSLFRVPMRVHNGLLLMTYLATNYGSKAPISLDDIAEREKLSQGFLEESAMTLKTAGLIKGRRGQGGGYLLTQSPDLISISSVIEALEGPVALVDCLTEDATCPAEHGCSNRIVWKRVQDRITETLQRIMLAELITDNYLLRKTHSTL